MMTDEQKPCGQCELYEMALVWAKNSPENAPAIIKAALDKTNRHTCGSRMSQSAFLREENLDLWYKGTGLWSTHTPFEVRSCSFCGSIHGEDAVRLMAEFGWTYEQASGKNYKGYLHNRMSQSGQGKLYGWHLTPEQASAMRRLCVTPEAAAREAQENDNG